MDQATITELTRRGLRNPRFSSTDIEAMTLQGVLTLGNEIKTCAPSFFRGRKILTSYTNVFNWPDDCQTVLNVFDSRTNSTAITDATNASPINIEAADHGLVDDDIAFICDVGGNTAANGLFKVTNVDDDNVTLNGSTGNAAYTSGGYIIKWDQNSFRKLVKKNAEAQSLRDRGRWYPEGKTVVVDYIDFSYDLIVDYSQRPDSITDIPSEYHMGLVGWNVMMLLKVPMPDSPDYADLSLSYKVHQALFASSVESIRSTLLASNEADEITDLEHWDII
jgi:hypothetical protein